MKPYLGLFVAFFVLTLVSCVGITPSSAAENLAECMQSGQYERAAENLATDPDATPEQKEQCKKEFITSLKEKEAKYFAKNGDLKSYTIIDEAVTPDESKAFVRIRYGLGNGSSLDEIIPLVKSGGRWKYICRDSKAN
ncbi:DUF4878 domain-containing protein [Paludibacter sp.]|uniref:DUF4878 domain-containing protein n=1 Tax=Paludibacter sp. TaxID=1898105 RepID=UPI0013540341|nr:DUF4878 domain-containing protein [Paludibacter sp.]MTK54540.1 DUF4878 domain-containing protein [Paludibacter sp.]